MLIVNIFCVNWVNLIVKDWTFLCLGVVILNLVINWDLKSFAFYLHLLKSKIVVYFQNYSRYESG